VHELHRQRGYPLGANYILIWGATFRADEALLVKNRMETTMRTLATGNSAAAWLCSAAGVLSKPSNAKQGSVVSSEESNVKLECTLMLLRVNQ